MHAHVPIPCSKRKAPSQAVTAFKNPVTKQQGMRCRLPCMFGPIALHVTTVIQSILNLLTCKVQFRSIRSRVAVSYTRRLHRSGVSTKGFITVLVGQLHEKLLTAESSSNEEQIKVEIQKARILIDQMQR
jgi:hypothetical protein